MRCWPPWRREKRGTPSLLDYYPARDFVVGDYLDRMIELASELAGKPKKAHRITLWWGEDGLELQTDGSVNKIKRPTKSSPLPPFIPYTPLPMSVFDSCLGYSPYQQTSALSEYNPLMAQINASISAQSAIIAAQMVAAAAPITSGIENANMRFIGSIEDSINSTTRCCVESERDFQKMLGG